MQGKKVFYVSFVRNKVIATTIDIRFRLVMLIAACMLPVYGILFYNALFLRDSKIQEVKLNLQAQAESNAAGIDQAIRSAASLLNTLSKIPQLRSLDDTAPCKILGSLIYQDSRYNSGYIIRPDGFIHCSSVLTNARGNESDQSYFRRAMASGKVEVGSPTICDSSDRYCVPIALALRDERGQVTSVLALDLDPEWFAKHEKIIWSEPNTLMVWWEGESRVAFAWPQSESWIGKLFTSSQVGIRMIGKSAGNFIEKGIDGNNKLFGFSTIRGIGYPDLKLSLGVPQNDILAPIQSYFLKNLAYLTVVTLLVLISAWMMGGLIIRRVTIISQIVRHIGTKNRRSNTESYTGIDKRRGMAEADYTKDEFGMLEYAISELEEKHIQEKRKNYLQYGAIIEKLSEGVTLYKLEGSLLQNSSVKGNSDTWLQTTLENLSEGVSLFDLHGNLLYCNHAGLDMFGFSAVEDYRRCQQSGLDKIFEFASLEGILWPVEQWPLARLLRGEELHDMNVLIRNVHDNRQKVFNFCGSLINDKNGEPLMAVLVMSYTAHKTYTEKNSQ